MLGNDQTGHERPVGGGYDAGSFEFDLQEIWPPAAGQAGAAALSAGGSNADEAKVHTCVTVNDGDNGIAIAATYGLGSGVQCQEIDASGIGIRSVIDAGFEKAVDIWGYVEQGVRVCFDAAGPVALLDAATSPRTVYSIDAYTVDARTCTTIWRAGSVVLQAPRAGADPWPVATALPLPLPSPTPAPQCLGSATAAVNLRDAPDGTRIGGVFPGATLTVLARSGGWYEVDNLGVYGWISADYFSLSGECNFGAE